VAVATAAVVGYNNGLGNRQHAFGAITLVVVITIVIWVIIDIDRPRRGLIQVSQQSMISLQEFITRDHP
jgi:hypothetical protein